MNYGLPYMGSKNSIAEWVVDNLPKADTLVDVFAGGCAITHAGMVKRKFNNFIANDITTTPQCFLDAINGKYRDEKRWISREDFFALKDSDDYVKLCFSFGNDGQTYAYARELELWKKALHYYWVFGDKSLFEMMGIFGELSKKDIKQNQDKYKKQYIEWLRKNTDFEEKKLGRVYELQSLKRLQSLERLERLQSLESLESLEVTQKDYQEIDLPQDATIYADKPYFNTRQYQKEGFDHERFYRWCKDIKRPVIVSEYWMPDDFICVAQKEKRVIMAAKQNNLRKMEKLFILKEHEQWYWQKMREQGLHTSLF